MANLLNLLKKEQSLLEKIELAEFKLNKCENDNYGPILLELDDGLKEVQDKIITALIETLKERVNNIRK